MSVTIKIEGLKEIEAAVKALPLALQHSVLSSAHANAAKPLVTKMQLTAPEGPTGNLVDSIGIVKASVKKANEVGEIKVGPRRKGRYKGFAGHLVEYGTKRRTLRGRGKYPAGTDRGIMPKTPFVEPSFRATKAKVEKGIAEQTGKALIRTMKRYLR